MAGTSDANVRITVSLKDNVSSEAKKPKAAFDSITKSIGGLKAALAGLGLGILFRSIFNDVKRTAEEIENVGKAASTVGVAVETFSALGYAAEQSESSVGSLADGLRFLAKNIEEARKGSKEIQDSFANIGINVKEINGVEDAFFKLSDQLAKTSDAGKRVETAMALLGRGGADLVPFMSQGSAAIKELMANADRLGITLSQDMVRDADAFGDSLNDLVGSLAGFKREIYGAAFDDLTVFFKSATNLVSDLRRQTSGLTGDTEQYGETGAFAFGKIAKAIVAVSIALKASYGGMKVLGDIILVIGAAITDLSDKAFVKLQRAVTGFQVTIAETVHFMKSSLGLFKDIDGEVDAFYRSSIERMKELIKLDAEGNAFQNTQDAIAALKTDLEELGNGDPLGDIETWWKKIDEATANALQQANEYIRIVDSGRQANPGAGPITFPGGPALATEDNKARQEEAMAEWKRQVEEAGKQLEFLQAPVNSLQGAFADTFKAGITGAKSFGEAMKDLGKSFVDIIAEMIAQMLAALAIKALLFAAGTAVGGPAGGFIAGGLGNAVPIPGGGGASGNPIGSVGQASALGAGPVPMVQSGSQVTAITVNNISAIDSQSFADAVRRNPDAFAPVVRHSLENSASVQTAMAG